MEKLTDTQKIKIMLESICGNTQEIINGADNDVKVISDNFEAIYNKLLSIEKKLEEKENENELKELWKSVCVAYINASNSTTKEKAPFGPIMLLKNTKNLLKLINHTKQKL